MFDVRLMSKSLANKIRIVVDEREKASRVPDILSELGVRLLKTFKTPRAVFTANRYDMARVQGIGRAKALKIEMALDTGYKETSELDKQAKLSD